MVGRIIRCVVVMVLLGLVWPPLPAATLAQDASDDRYEDPGGRFSVPVPAGWIAEDPNGYGVLTSPDGGITVSVLAVDASDAVDGIDVAWQIVEPDFAMEPLQIAPIPPPPGTDAATVITYDTGEVSGEVVQALAVWVSDGTAYIMLIRADLAEAVERSTQINIIASGLTITGQQQVSIEGVAPAAFQGDLIKAFEDYVIEMMDVVGVPGASIAIVQDGAVVYREGFGVTEIGGDELVAPETRMMIGSTTKPMTTMMLATLVDAGIIGWDTPVVDLLPGFAVADPELTPQITVQDLVCACTGVSRRDLELLFNGDELTAQDIVDSLATLEIFTPIGEVFQYSNQMVATAGYAGGTAERDGGSGLFETYAAAMTDRVLGPIGMEDSTFSFEAAIADGNYAMPHGLTLDGEYVEIPLDMERWVLASAPAGALWSNVDDLSRFMLTLLARGVTPEGTRVVSEENLQHTWEPLVAVTSDVSYGLGWFVETYKGRQLLHHGGNTLGFTSDFAFMPDAGIGIVVLTNGQGATLFTEALRYWFLELVFDLDPEIKPLVEAILEGEAEADEIDTGAPVPMATPEGEAVDADPADVIPFAGRYVNPALGELDLEINGDAVYLDAGEFRATLRASPDSPEGTMGFLMADPPLAGMPVVLRVDEAGQATIVVGRDVYAYTFLPVDAPPVATPVASPAVDSDATWIAKHP